MIYLESSFFCCEVYVFNFLLMALLFVSTQTKAELCWVEVTGRKWSQLKFLSSRIKVLGLHLMVLTGRDHPTKSIRRDATFATFAKRHLKL